MATVNLELATVMQSVAWLSGVQILSALNEIGLVTVYANGREKCCANAIATVTALERGCVKAYCVCSRDLQCAVNSSLGNTKLALRKAVAVSTLLEGLFDMRSLSLDKAELPGASPRDDASANQR
jgi:hypothetical protein